MNKRTETEKPPVHDADAGILKEIRDRARKRRRDRQTPNVEPGIDTPPNYAGEPQCKTREREGA